MLRTALFALPLCACLLAPAIGSAEGVALTFDDLPLNGTLPADLTETQNVRNVLSVLKTHHVPQVYGFVNAKELEGNPDGAKALKAWVAGGERVGNHTYAHSDLDTESADAFLQDLRENEPTLELLDPGNSWRWLRYPFLREGDTLEKRHAVREELQHRGYRIAQVTLDYEDYLWNTPYARCVAKGDSKSIEWLRTTYLSMASQYLDSDRVMAQAIYGREISHVLLLHLGAFSSTILPDLLDLLRRKGFQLMTLEEAERDPAYADPPDAASKESDTLLEQGMNAHALKYPHVPNKPYKELEVVCQ